MLKVFTFILLVISIGSAQARVADVKFRSIEARDGLSSNHVNDILRDSRGYMWFATASGLTRYDGYDMKVYHCVHSDTASIQDNYVQSIQEMPDGRLIICAGDMYSVYDPQLERFRRYTVEDYRRAGLPDIPNLMLIDGDRLWITVRGHGLYICSAGKIRSVESAALSSRDLTDIIPNSGGHAVAVNDAGEIFEIDSQTYGVRRVAHLPAHRSANSFYQLYADRRGRIWVFGGNGVDVFDPAAGYAVETAAVPRWSDRPVNSVSEDADGRLWIGYDNAGLEIIERDGSSRLYASDATDRTSLGNNSVKVIYNDSTGGMWVGSYKKGVSVYFPSENKFDSWIIADINCITPVRDHPGQVWLGGDYAGLMLLDINTGQTTPVTDPDSQKSPRAIVTMATDRKGGLWYGTYNDGLHYRRGDHTRHITAADGLASPNVWALEVNSDGTLWVGTLGGGLQLYDPVTDRFTTLTLENSGLPSPFIHTLAAGTDGMLYAGTPHGIAVVDPHKRRVSMLGAQSPGGEPLMLSNNNINHLLQDSRGLLWIGTREGLDVYDSKSDSLYHVELDPKFSNLFILGILEGVDRSVWVTVDSRIYNVKVDYDRSARAYRFRSAGYDERDGLLGGTFNQRSMALLPGGDILAGCLSGVIRIDPDRIDYVPSNRRISFTDLYVRGERIDVARSYDGRVILPRSLAYMKEVRLGHDQNDVAIYFANDNFSGSGSTEYEYMLVGLDRDWQLCPRGSHSVRFAGLAPGRYALKVRAVDADGAAAPSVAVLEIVVDAPWYATWWAYVIYFLLVAGCLVGLIRLIQRRESRIFDERQKEEQARKTEELNQLKFKFFTNISHELRTPLTLILSPVEAMLRETEDPRNVKRLGVVKTNAQKLLILVNQLLDFRKNEMAGLTLHAAPTDLVTAVRAVCDQFAGLTERRGLAIRFSSDCDSLTMSLDGDKISKTVMNLLSNAVKYTPDGGSVDVSVRRRAGSAVIEVADTGRGIPDVDKAHIFERFYRGTDKSDQNTGSGIGLSLVYEYVKLHGGTVDVRDNHPTGAVFTVSLPLTAADTAAAAAAAPEPAAESARPAGPHRPTILFVDDNSDLTDFLRDEFSSAYDVLIASDGIAALETVRANPARVDLIVTDLMMPRMDGIQLSRALKADRALVDIPLIILTAKQDTATIVEGLTLGADDYLTKPFDNDVLRLKIARLLAARGRGARRTLIEPTPEPIQITPLDEQLVEKAVRYVEDNMQRSDLTVEEMSRSLGMSRVHLYKKILALTGKTPIEFIRVLRLKRAAQYLRESQLSVAEIAYKLGFNNPKYFSKYFREEYGISPSDYQMKNSL